MNTQPPASFNLKEVLITITFPTVVYSSQPHYLYPTQM